jgi:hypothetical protein
MVCSGLYMAKPTYPRSLTSVSVRHLNSFCTTGISDPFERCSFNFNTKGSNMRGHSLLWGQLSVDYFGTLYLLLSSYCMYSNLSSPVELDFPNNF